MKGDKIVRLSGKHVTKYKNIQKYMVKFLRNYLNCGIKIAGVKVSYHQIYQLTVIYFNSVRCWGSVVMPLPCVPARVTRGVLVAHRHSFAPPRCRTSQYRRSFVPHSVSVWNDLSDPVFDGVGLVGFKSRANAFLLA